MGHPFESESELSLDAGVDAVWAAIATGPGVDSWFMGANEVEPGEGGTVRTAFLGYTPQSTITAWEPGRRLAHTGEPADDGRFVAYEFLLEGRSGGSTVLRAVTSGFLPGDDWEGEYAAMRTGGATFLATLREYVEHFAGRAATPVTAVGPLVTDWPATRARLHRALGLGIDPAPGDRARFEGPAGPVEGAVYVVTADTIGLRTPDALLRFVRGFGGPLLAMHHLFEPAGPADPVDAWAAWLAGPAV